MKIYFGGSIVAGRGDAGIYKELILHLKKYGKVLTEHIGDPNLTVSGEVNSSGKFIHDRDIAWLKESDVLVMEVTTPSLGVGYEIGRATEHNKKILCLYRPSEGKMLSRMISGCPSVHLVEYQTLDDAKKAIDEFFKK